MALTALDIVVPHKLGIAEAEKRLMKLLQDPQPADSPIKIAEINWNAATATLAFTVSVKGVQVQGRAVVAPEYVSLNTDPLKSWWLAPVVMYAQSKIKAALSKALA